MKAKGSSHKPTGRRIFGFPVFPIKNMFSFDLGVSVESEGTQGNFRKLTEKTKKQIGKKTCRGFPSVLSSCYVVPVQPFRMCFLILSIPKEIKRPPVPPVPSAKPLRRPTCPLASEETEECRAT